MSKNNWILNQWWKKGIYILGWIYLSLIILVYILPFLIGFFIGLMGF